MELTIAVCTYRRFKDLRVCLENIQRQTIDRSRFRVLVVDNSLQPEESAAFRDSLDLDYEFEYLITPQNGIAYARNQAIAHCQTPYLGYVDDDVIIEPDWAEVMLDTFARYEGRAGCVSGKITPRFEGTPPVWLKDELLWPLAVTNWGDEEKLLPSDEWFVTASIGFDVRALRISGGFSEDLGRKGRILLAHEDLQIVTNLRRMGYGLVYNPAFRAEHCIPASRMTQQWYCKDAFWQSVSRMVYACGKAFDPEGALAKQLTKAADKEQARWRDQPDKERVRLKLVDVSARAAQLMRRFGYDPTRRFPDPEFRTFYIVTPVFNAIETIEETFKSILSQSGDHFIRYHVQDGGSTDGTLELIKKWVRRVNNDELPFPVLCRGIHMTWRSQDDAGMYDGLDKAFASLLMEPEDVMCWLNADDVLAENALSTMDKVFKEDDTYWAIGPTAVLDYEGNLLGPWTPAYPTKMIKEGLCDGVIWNHIQQEGSFWRKALWDKAGKLNTTLKYAGDWDLWRRYAQYAYPVHVETPIAYFRQREGQLSDNISDYEAEINRIVPKDQRIAAAAAIAPTARQITYQRFDLESGKKIAGKLVDSSLPKQAYEGFEEFSKVFFDRLETGSNEASTDDQHVESSFELELQAIDAKGLASQPGGHGKQSLLRKVIINDATRQIFNALPNGAQGAVQNFRQKGISPLAQKLRRHREYRAIEKSRLFFRQFYLDTYPDVVESGVDPLDHFIAFGSKEGRSPNPLFCEVFYKSTYPDVAETGTSGLLHYITSGWKERRDPHRDFSTSYYLSSNPDVEENGINPLSHYLHYGLNEGRSAHWNDLHELDDVSAVSSSLQEYRETVSPQPVVEAEHTITPTEWMKDKGYSMNRHWAGFESTAISLMGQIPVPEEVDLKVYQDLFTAQFIERFVPKGARLLEIGGGDSRILRHFSKDYECWNLDKLEGHGNGPTSISDMDVKLVRDYIGEFNSELPENYFDFIFSISVLEHIQGVPASVYQNILDDIARVSRAGCQNLHTIDIVYKKLQGDLWACQIVDDWMPKVAGRDWAGLKAEIMQDEGRFEMSRARYERSWQFTTGKDYDQFGSPISLNLYW